MFRCQNKGCSKITEPHQPANMVVLQTRSVTYENEIHKKCKRKPWKKSDRRIQQGETKFLISTGTEIVKEIACCPECYVLLTGLEPRKYKPPTGLTLAQSATQQTKRIRRRSKKKEPPKKAPIVEVVNLIQIVTE